MVSVGTNWDSEKDCDNIVEDKTRFYDEVTLLKYFTNLMLKVESLIFLLVSYSSQKDCTCETWPLLENENFEAIATYIRYVLSKLLKFVRISILNSSDFFLQWIPWK